jgi:hypothetical protein
MPIESKQKQIGERLYTVTQYTAMRALDVFELVSPVIAPVLGKLSSLGPDADIGPVVEAAVSKLGGGKLRQLTQVLLEPVQVTEASRIRGMLDGFDVAYAGNLGEVFQVLAFAVEVQFGSFFSGWLSAPQEAAVQPSVSLNGSAPVGSR